MTTMSRHPIHFLREQNTDFHNTGKNTMPFKINIMIFVDIKHKKL